MKYLVINALCLLVTVVIAILEPAVFEFVMLGICCICTIVVGYQTYLGIQRDKEALRQARAQVKASYRWTNPMTGAEHSSPDPEITRSIRKIHEALLPMPATRKPQGLYSALKSFSDPQEPKPPTKVDLGGWINFENDIDDPFAGLSAREIREMFDRRGKTMHDLGREPRYRRPFAAATECPDGHFGIHTFVTTNEPGSFRRSCSDPDCTRTWIEATS